MRNVSDKQLLIIAGICFAILLIIVLSLYFETATGYVTRPVTRQGNLVTTSDIQPADNPVVTASPQRTVYNGILQGE